MDRSELIATMLENSNLMKRGMGSMVHRVMRDLPVTPSQLELLYMIRATQPTSAKDLAKNRQLTPGAVSQLVDTLSEKALISRTPTSQDRRTYNISTTATAEDLLKTVETRRNDLFRRAMQNLTDEELALWLKVQTKLMHEFEQFTDTENKQEGTS